MGMFMAYCRFANTLEALKECDEWLRDHEPSELSAEELAAYKRLLKLARRMGEDAEES